MRANLSLCFLVSLVPTVAIAGPYTTCSWSVNPVDVWMNPTNLCTQSWCYSETEVVANLKNAVNAWNHSGADIELRYAGSDSSKTTADSDEILVLFEDEPIDDCFLGLTGLPDKTTCYGGVVTVFMQTSDPTCPLYPVIERRTSYVESDVTRPVFIAVFVHEIGHRMGLLDNTSSPRTTVMNGWGGNVNHARYLWPWDKEALRNDPQYGYGMYLGSDLVVKDSTDATTWTAGPSPGDTTVYTPGITKGADRFVLVYVDADSETRIRSRIATTGAWGQAYDTGVDSYEGPDVAYGSGKFVMVYTDTNDERHINVKWSTTGSSWTGGPEYVAVGRPVPCYVRPTISYNSSTEQFHVVAAARGTSHLCTYTAYASDLTAWASDCGDNDDETAISGAGLVCNASNQCTYGWSSSASGTNTGRNGTGQSLWDVLSIISGISFTSFANVNYSAAFDGGSGYLLLGKARAYGPGTLSGTLFKRTKTSWNGSWGSSVDLGFYADYGADVTWDAGGSKYRLVYSN